MNQSEFARLIGRSPTYVRERINDEKEWALGDIERMCKLWGLTPTQLIEGAPRLDDAEHDRAPVEPDFLTMAAKHGDTEAEREAAYREARGTDPIDIDAWADRIKAEDKVNVK
ncbi:hypothetical protein [Bifidobacterium jacchi]|uniref:Uncharacterized protein n=1 Tax=Bifidobacterium jacchi TaxID=2490545 RepID=A0A5N5RN44_9BIFI|nr:hypothetical protein [Bifidobacterium jacchi]KAB5608379.1 hypothetical protein EHS19_01790 [Bifidobacterium jacchi]